MLDRKLAVEGKHEAVGLRLGAARWLVLRGFDLFDHGNRLDLRDVRAEKVDRNGGSRRCIS